MKAFKPELVAIRNGSLIGQLKEALADADYKPVIIAGEEGVIEVCHCNSDPFFFKRRLES